MTFSNLLFKEIRLFLAVFTVFTLSAMALAHTGPTHNKVVVCYISSWAVYRPEKGSYKIENFDPNLCTHAIYAFAGLDITESAIKSLDPWQDLKENFGKGGYERLTNLKNTHTHLKVSLAIGGWNEDSENYSSLVSNPLQREKFVKQVTSFVKKYNFDGLDLNWSYPTQRGGKAEDRENFVLLTKELREEFDKYNLLLTSAIAAKKDILDKGYDVRGLSRYLDFLHIMCYDYHATWDNQIGFNAPLTSTAGDVLSVQYTIDYLIKFGAPPSKLVLGLPFYGKSFNTAIEGKIGDVTDGTGLQGPFTRENGFIGYNEICLMLSRKNSGWTSIWDADASEVIARSERDDSNGLTGVITFGNSRSIANKVMFAMRKSLAGVSVWSVDTDDFLGECDLANDTFADYKTQRQSNRFNSNYVLLRTVNEATIYALEEIAIEQQRVKQQMEQTARQQAEEQMKEQAKQQAKQPVKLQMNEQVEKKMDRLICFLTIPKRCFPNE